MEKLNLIEWNVKNMHDTPCNQCVADKLLEGSGEPDVIFLSEYSYNANRNEFVESKISEKYRIISKQNSGIMIAIKKEINCVPGPASTVEGQHFLAKKIIIDGKIIKLVGVRIQVDSGNASEEEQKNRKNQLKKIISALKKDKNVIIMGDFNNYRCLGDENDINNYIEIYESEKKVQKIYNLQSVKKLFFDNGYEYKKSTPEGDQYSYKLGNARYKYDHIFAKGDLFVESPEYDWEWEKSETKGYNPDHALLKATVEIKR